ADITCYINGKSYWYTLVNNPNYATPGDVSRKEILELLLRANEVKIYSLHKETYLQKEISSNFSRFVFEDEDSITVRMCITG
ncbi:MAG: hypothetical protein ACKO96_34960, partial [Flammeovirgaceae bacterium]